MPALDERTKSQLNSQELESPARKRTLDDFLVRKTDAVILHLDPAAGGSPPKSSPGLTASGSSPLEGNSPSPNVTPKKPSSQELATATTKTTKPTLDEPPAKKRKMLTPQEKAAKALADEQKKKEKEAAKAEREAAKAAKEAEKAAEKAAREAEKAAKDAEKARIAEEKRKEKEAAQAKKAGIGAGQKRLTDMFVKKPQPTTETDKVGDISSVSTANTSTTDNTSFYHKLFKAFHVKENVTVARLPHGMDETTREAKAQILCSAVEGGEQAEVMPLSKMSNEKFLDLFQLPCPGRRGRVYPTVRSILAQYHGNDPSAAIDLTGDSQKSMQASHALEALRSIPVKSLKFREDVRPPYIGTVSGLPPGVKSLKVIARRPYAKVAALDYDYDSEAEWQEDDGEDVEDLDDDEEEQDADEEMDDFLDDSEDTGPSRLVFSGGMEPESTGLCWENRKRLNSPAKVFKFRTEVVLQSLEHSHSIDPWSDKYWEPEITKAEVTPPKLVVTATTSSSKADPTTTASAPTNALQLLTKTQAASVANKKATKPLSPDMHAELRNFMKANSHLTKLGLIELFYADHTSCVKTSIKASFEMLAMADEKSGRGKRKHWVLRDDV